MAPSWATVSLLLPVLLSGPVRAAGPSPLALERTIPLPGVSGRINHLAVDFRRGRLFVAELGNGTLDVVDLAAGKAIHRIAGMKELQGIGYSPQADVIAVASAGDGSVRLFKREDFSPLGVVSPGEEADNVHLDARTGHLVIGYGNGGLAVLDPVGRSVVGTNRLPAHPEGFQFDPGMRRAS